MTTVTPTEHEAMSWHARQTLNQRLLAETTRCIDTLHDLDTQIRERRAALLSGEIERRETADAADHFAQARAILQGLTPDPNAAAHRVELDRAVRPADKRKDAA